MMNKHFNPANSPTVNIALPRHRVPEQRQEISLPPGTTVVAADNHWSVMEDIFFERCPAHLKDRVPRIHRDSSGYCEWSVGGKSLIPPVFKRVFESYEHLPGCVEMKPRLSDLDEEGIQKEIVFGNAINAFLGYPDLEVRECVFRIYNKYLAALGASAPGRFHGVGLVNYWDMDKVRDSIAEVKALGLKTYLLPMFPKATAGVDLNYCLPEMEPLWQAADDAGLPICFHVGEVFADGPGGAGTTAMITFSPFRKNLGELIFGGILDRHPGLQVVFLEADLNWIPGALQTAEMAYDCFKPIMTPAIEHRPSHYWYKNCYAGFMYDPAGLSMLELIGADRVMWTSDYPHLESTFGYGWKAIKAVIDATTSDQARMILGGTAMKVFQLN